MRARWFGLIVAALAPALAGCGGIGLSGATSTIGDQLTIYSSLPLQGPAAPLSEQIVNGEKLALSRAGGQVGRFTISYYSLDDSNPTSGQWDPGETAQDAKTAAQDNSTIAYLGDYDSDATAISLPLINAAGILQISPASPYVGLTSSQEAGQDEPERFYPTGIRTYGSLLPGDQVQAAAQTKVMLARGIRRLYVLSSEDPFQLPLAQILAADARAAGIQVLATSQLNIEHQTNFDALAEEVSLSRAQAVFFSGSPTSGTVALWRALYRANPGLQLFGSSALANDSFAARIGSAARNTLIGTPILPTRMYPASAQEVLREYRRLFGTAGSVYALYGYEAMQATLAAIRAAGAHGNDRRAVVREFFALRDRDSVLGRYSISPSGQSTLRTYGFDRVSAGQLVFDQAVQTP